jgi:hypothetical protein
MNLPTASETAQALMWREYMLKKILFAGGAVSTAGKAGRFVITVNGDMFSDFDFNAVIARAFESLDENNRA